MYNKKLWNIAKILQTYETFSNENSSNNKDMPNSDVFLLLAYFGGYCRNRRKTKK
jgi:hypothetical protein